MNILNSNKVYSVKSYGQGEKSCQSERQSLACQFRRPASGVQPPIQNGGKHTQNGDATQKYLLKSGAPNLCAITTSLCHNTSAVITANKQTEQTEERAVSHSYPCVYCNAFCVRKAKCASFEITAPCEEGTHKSKGGREVLDFSRKNLFPPSLPSLLHPFCPHQDFLSPYLSVSFSPFLIPSSLFLRQCLTAYTHDQSHSEPPESTELVFTYRYINMKGCFFL